ncbi:hypothetical protein VTK73DRAFT_8323 [Phialemonium thermophilum]|uniref:Rrn7/TAF1B C-terminal cyclin domain-containing protein n=1 Tax=Phialemonium thermophilum TaxID=223376 RepID=A0ABR3Y664_9PEZI
MRGRLPAAYHGALRSRAAGVRPGELHEAVMNLTYSYGKNYDITFPPLNVPVIVLQYLKEMGLPVNLYPYIKECVSLLQLSYAIPTGGQKPLDNPDTLLIATVVVVTKLFHPLDGPENEPATESSPSGLKIDWQQWQRIFADTERLNTSRRDFDSVTPKEVGTMTGEEMDAYLEWFQQTRIMPQEDTRTIERLFPLGVSASPVEVDDTEEDNRRLEQRLLELQQHISWVNPELPIGQVPDSRSSSGGGRSYRRYENVDSLSGPAELFHQRAAMLSGLSIEGLLKAVFKLEQLLLYWTKYAQTESENDLKAEIEGSSNRSLARLLARKQIY